MFSTNLRSLSHKRITGLILFVVASFFLFIRPSINNYIRFKKFYSNSLDVQIIEEREGRLRKFYKFKGEDSFKDIFISNSVISVGDSLSKNSNSTEIEVYRQYYNSNAGDFVLVTVLDVKENRNYIEWYDFIVD